MRERYFFIQNSSLIFFLSTHFCLPHNLRISLIGWFFFLCALVILSLMESSKKNDLEKDSDQDQVAFIEHLLGASTLLAMSK